MRPPVPERRAERAGAPARPRCGRPRGAAFEWARQTDGEGRVREIEYRRFFVADGGGDAFAVATPVRYAKYHETGTSEMPARPVMPFDKDGNPRSPAVERAVRRAMEARIQSLLGR